MAVASRANRHTGRAGGRISCCTERQVRGAQRRFKTWGRARCCTDGWVLALGRPAGAAGGCAVGTGFAPAACAVAPGPADAAASARPHQPPAASASGRKGRKTRSGATRGHGGPHCRAARSRRRGLAPSPAPGGGRDGAAGGVAPGPPGSARSVRRPHGHCSTTPATAGGSSAARSSAARPAIDRGRTAALWRTCRAHAAPATALPASRPSPAADRAGGG